MKRINIITNAKRYNITLYSLRFMNCTAVNKSLNCGTFCSSCKKSIESKSISYYLIFSAKDGNLNKAIHLKTMTLIYTAQKASE